MCDNIFFEFSNIEKLRNTLIIPKRKSSLDYQYNFYTLPYIIKGIKRYNFTEKYLLNNHKDTLPSIDVVGKDPVETIIDLYI